MRIVFMGTPDFAVPSLRLLAQEHEVTLVVTRPDAVRGRGRKLVASPVKEAALELGIEVVAANRVNAELIDQIAATSPDVICVAAFGALLPDALLEVAPYGCVNVHGSLLPRWRGAAPIQRAILAGDTEVGISIMRIVHDLDAGDYCRQAAVEVGDKGSGEIMGELAEIGARELCAALTEIASGSVEWQAQDESLVTYAHKVTKADLALAPELSARENALRVAASTDAAPARAVVGGKGLRVMRAKVADERVGQGSAQKIGRKRVVLGCADGSLELTCVKPDGKREMEAQAFWAGLRVDATTWERA